MRLLACLAAVTLAIGCSSTSGDGVAAADDAVSENTANGAAWCPTPSSMPVTASPSDYLAPITVALDSTIDGDTAYFKLASGTVERVRFMHINAEEVRHPDASPSQNAKATAWGQITKDYVNGLLSNARTIQIASHRSAANPNAPDTDVFGRWLALIYVDGELLQQKLIVEGYSGYYTKYGCATGPLHDSLLWSEAQANQHNLGIWDPAYKNEHLPVLEQWIGLDTCRPDPLKGQKYCE